MARSRALIATGVLLATLGMLLTGCSSGSAKASATTTVTVTATPSRPSSSSAATPPAAGDQQACADIERVIVKMTMAAVNWRPAVKPFDKRVGKKIGLLAQEMAVAERKATTGQVRTGVHQSTLAFTSLARAMAGNKRAKVFNAVGRTQKAYGELKQVCGLG